MRTKTNTASLALLLILSAFAAMPARAAMVSIVGGVASAMPPRNDVLGAAGITMGDGSIWIDGTLTLANDATSISLFDVGSETRKHTLIKLSNDAGPTLTDATDFRQGSGVHQPWQFAGSVMQDAGPIGLSFARVPGFGASDRFDDETRHTGSTSFARIAFAYLDPQYRIVRDPTDTVLVLFDDRFEGPDRDFDDYVGVLKFTSPMPVPLPGALLLLVSGLGGLALIRPRQRGTSRSSRDPDRSPAACGRFQRYARAAS